MGASQARARDKARFIKGSKKSAKSSSSLVDIFRKLGKARARLSKTRLDSKSRRARKLVKKSKNFFKKPPKNCNFSIKLLIKFSKKIIFLFWGKNTHFCYKKIPRNSDFDSVQHEFPGLGSARDFVKLACGECLEQWLGSSSLDKH